MRFLDSSYSGSIFLKTLGRIRSEPYSTGGILWHSSSPFFRFLFRWTKTVSLILLSCFDSRKHFLFSGSFLHSGLRESRALFSDVFSSLPNFLLGTHFRGELFCSPKTEMSFVCRCFLFFPSVSLIYLSVINGRVYVWLWRIYPRESQVRSDYRIIFTRHHRFPLCAFPPILRIA